jgi:hypothetical protein
LPAGRDELRQAVRGHVDLRRSLELIDLDGGLGGPAQPDDRVRKGLAPPLHGGRLERPRHVVVIRLERLREARRWGHAGHRG